MALKRAKEKDFAKFIKMQQVRNFIEQNPMLFLSGMEFTIRTIIDAFNIVEPDFTNMSPEEIISAHQSYTNKRCQWQNRFNRVLAQRGMYMTKRYQHDLWLIRDDEGVQKKITTLHTDAKRSGSRSRELRRGFSRYKNTYRHVPDSALRMIVESGDPANWHNSDYVDSNRT